MNLTSCSVLVLNKNWQAINTRTVDKAIGMLASGAAMALDIDTETGYMMPVSWEEWLKLPVREGDDVIRTTKMAIRSPKVIVAKNWAKIPMRAPKFSPKAVYERDGGKCQYTGRHLKPGEGNIDHILPRSRGGGTSWENCVLSARDVNSKKADKTPEEAGLRLLRPPKALAPKPADQTIFNRLGIKEWGLFLKK